MIYINNRKEVTYVNFAWYGYTNGFQYAVNPNIEELGVYGKQIVDAVDGQGNPRTVGKGPGFGGRFRTNSQNQGYGIATEYQTSIPMKYPDGTVRLVGSPIINGFLLSDKDSLNWTINRLLNKEELRAKGEWAEEDDKKSAYVNQIAQHWAQYRLENGLSPNFDPEKDSMYYPEGFEQVGDDYGEYYYSDGMPKVYKTEDGKEPAEMSREEAESVFYERLKQARGDPESMAGLRKIIPRGSKIAIENRIFDKEIPVSNKLQEGHDYSKHKASGQTEVWDKKQNPVENDKAYNEQQEAQKKEKTSQKVDENKVSSTKSEPQKFDRNDNSSPNSNQRNIEQNEDSSEKTQ